MSNIVTMQGLMIPAPGEVDEDVLAGAEEFIEMVRGGMIRGFVLMAERTDGIYRSYEEGPFDLEPMLGHLSRQSYRLVKLAEEIDSADV